MTRAFLIGLALGVAAGCQTYDFERVEPAAIQQTTQSENIIALNLKPNVMLLVDTSGSMFDKVTRLPDGGPEDPPTCEESIDAGCRSRLNEMKQAVARFVDDARDNARLGLTFYPQAPGGGGDTAGCQGATSVRVELADPSPTDDGQDAINGAKADEVRRAVLATSAGGGTPTAESLRLFRTGTARSAVQMRDPDDLRDSLIILLTDGLPNCNSANPNNACSGPPEQQARCRCTRAGSCVGAFCSLLCLDQDATAREADRLFRELGIRTIVIGLGTETAASTGREVLQAVAQAGGFERRCLADGGTSTQPIPPDQGIPCAEQFFQAANADELGRVLQEVRNAIRERDPCVFALSRLPSRLELLSVRVNDATVPAGPDTWGLDAGARQLVFQGRLCTQDIRNSTLSNPVRVSINVVETL